MNRGTFSNPPGGQLRNRDARLMTSFGAAGSYGVMFPVGIDGLEIGVPYTFIAHQNSVGNDTANLDGTGSLAMKKGHANAPIVANDILTGMPVTVVYDGTNLYVTSNLASTVWSGGTTGVNLIAAGATTDIGSAPGTMVTISGTGLTITSLGTPYVGYKILKINSSGLIFQQNSVISLPGSVDYVTTANDIMVFAGFSVGLWRCVSILPAATYGAMGNTRENVNPVVNADCSVAQLGTSVAAVANNAYAGDGLRILSEAGGVVNWSRSTADAAIGVEFDDNAAVAIANNKFGLFRPIENIDLHAGSLLSGAAVIASVYCIGSITGGASRLALLAWTGAADAISATPISAWNGAGIDPTLIANWSYAGVTNLSTAGAITSVVGAIPASCTNLALFAWTNSKTANVADVLRVGNWQARKGSILLPFEPLSAQANLARCQRYFQKSFPLGTAPAQNAGVTGAFTSTLSVGGAVAAKWPGQPSFASWMRVAPSVVFFNPSAANAFARNTTLGTDATGMSANDVAEGSFNINATGLAAWAVGNVVAVHYTASARL